MPLHLPGIPIAVRKLKALDSLGKTHDFGGYTKSDALILEPNDKGDVISNWVSPTFTSYRRAWQKAADAHWVDPIEVWGDIGTDMDHLYPKSWAQVPNKKVSHIRLFPVWSEVNRSAGAGREKAALQAGVVDPKFADDIVYADELQVLKIIGHPVGTSTKPESIFEKKKKARR